MKLLIALFFLAVIGVLFFEALRFMSEEEGPVGPVRGNACPWPVNEIRNRARHRENSRSAATLAGAEQLRKDRALFFCADGQQIEDEHEHDYPSYGVWANKSTRASPLYRLGASSRR